MIYFEDEAAYYGLLDDIRFETYQLVEDPVYEFRVIFRRANDTGPNPQWFLSNRFRDYLTQAEFDATVPTTGEFVYALWQFSRRERIPGSTQTLRKISDDEYDDASEGLYNRWFLSLIHISEPTRPY